MGTSAIHHLLAQLLPWHHAVDPPIVAATSAGAAFLATLVVNARDRRRGLHVYRAVARAAAKSQAAMTAGERDVLDAIAASLRLDKGAVAKVEAQLALGP